MISGSLDSRRAGSRLLLVVIGLSAMIYAGLVHSEACLLSSQHAGVTFPVEQIEAGWGCSLQSIISDYTTANKIGPIQVLLPAPVYRFLLDRPPMTAALINRLDLSPYRSEARGPGRFFVNDGEGTEGMIELVYQDPTNRIYYVEGTHTSTLLPDINGKAIVFVKMGPGQDGQGNEAVETTLVAYAKLNSRLLAGLVSLIRPLLDRTIARKLTKGITVVNRLGQEMRQHPDRIIFEATVSPSLPSEEVAFLKQALESLGQSSNRTPSRALLP
ncbi:MAG: hypothetical protein CAF45_010550 [Nitrospira sp. CG24E]|mgnify:CR=1 FL=1|nr:MAG: hypothetical protein CAF45_010550 [Nitrospira sp. CG24E]